MTPASIRTHVNRAKEASSARGGGDMYNTASSAVVPSEKVFLASAISKASSEPSFGSWYFGMRRGDRFLRIGGEAGADIIPAGCDKSGKCVPSK